MGNHHTARLPGSIVAAIAADAGLTVASVSRVMHGAASPATRARVLLSAARIGVVIEAPELDDDDTDTDTDHCAADGRRP